MGSRSSKVFSMCSICTFALWCAFVPACSGPDVVQEIALPDSTGVSVLELTRAYHEVDFKQTSAGAFIEAIDGVRNRDDTYWLYYVNDSSGTMAADRYIVREGDRVEWRYISGY